MCGVGGEGIRALDAHSRARTHSRARAQTRARARTHTHTHAPEGGHVEGRVVEHLGVGRVHVRSLNYYYYYYYYYYYHSYYHNYYHCLTA